jgi:hypothetical protein
MAVKIIAFTFGSDFLPILADMSVIKDHFNSVAIALAIIFTGAILGTSFVHRNVDLDTISVTGKAEKNFTSDLIVWKGSYARSAATLKDAYAAVNADAELVKSYLNTKGVDINQCVFSAVDIEKVYNTETDKNGNTTSTFVGYHLRQQVTIQSTEVDKIERLSREVTELINQGLELNSDAPEYYYTQLAALKIEMIAEATKDARTRAEKIAVESGASLGHLKSGDMGVFQIVAPNSSEDDYSWGGSFNTSSKEKSASITMSLVFGVD